MFVGLNTSSDPFSIYFEEQIKITVTTVTPETDPHIQADIRKYTEIRRRRTTTTTRRRRTRRGRKRKRRRRRRKKKVKKRRRNGDRVLRKLMS